MKKRLTAILALATAFSIATSTALAVDAVKDTSSFNDLKDLDTATKAKYDEMIKAGVFGGMSDSEFGIKQKTTRAQFAKVAALIFQLKVDSSLKTSSFSDVKADDPANGYALPYIEAIYKAGITEGYESGQFNPSGEITKEQLAAFLLRGLGQNAAAESTTGVNDTTVSDWAKGYVALALKNKLLNNGADGTFGGTSAATRDLLLLGSYEAKKQYAPPAVAAVTTVSIVKAEAVGAKTIKVTLNGAIADTTKLNISVTRLGSAVTAAPKWNEAKNEAILTLENKMTEGKYTLRLDPVKDGGLTVVKENGSADVTVQNEKLTKIEFTSASDVIAQGKKVKIDFRALNQYNEQSDLSASRFTISTSPKLTLNTVAGSQSFTLDLYNATQKASKGGLEILDRDQMFTVTILSEENTLQANKAFKVGDIQSIAKVELGDIHYLKGKTSLEPGDKATMDYKAYDQYGFEVTDLFTLRKNTTTYFTGSGGILQGSEVDDDGNSYNKGFAFMDEDADNDGRPDLKITAAEVDNRTLFDNQDVQLSIMPYTGGQTATKNIKVTATNIPYEVTIGSPPKTIAWGDDDVYIPITVKDKQGNQLSTDDIVKNADDIQIYGKGTANVVVGTRGRVETSGAYRGQIKISGLKSNAADEAGKKSGSLTIETLVGRTGKTATLSTSVVERRYPNTVFVSVVPKPKMLPSLDMVDMKTENAFRFKYRDQYGEEFDRDYTGYSVQLTLERTAGTVTDAVYFSRGGYSPTNTTNLNAANNTILLDGVDASRDGYNPAATEIGYYRDKDIFFTANVGDNMEGSYQTTAKLYKGDRAAVTAGKASLVSTATTTTQLIKVKEADTLNYALTPFPNGIYAIDKIAGTLQGSPSVTIKGVTTTEGYSLENMFSGKIEVTAKDTSGNVVKLPNNSVMSVTVSSPAGAAAVNKPKADGAVANNFDAFGIRGKDVGTIGITAMIKPTNYGGMKALSIDKIQVKDDVLTTASLAATYNGKAKIIWLSQLKAGVNIFTGNDTGRLNQKQTFSNITLTDQYNNNTFKNSSVIRVAPVFGITIFISNIKWTSEIKPGTGYIAVESNINGVNNVNGLTNAIAPVPANTDPTDWVFGTVNRVQLNRGDAKYIYVPAKAPDGVTNVEIASFTATMVTASGKSISVDVYPDASK
ncbi:S-layer homology domain-containing protein [Paenibacillus sp. RC67]|uniref:S-layer homology domain-containing protein n=1 Tax=Paenibacillus sp. RC67 TaxID=3039392 RepID=UPI0024ACF0A2|nr:S-layer homology domain-containing protein [Paenibacillus sp. RC67]